MNVINCIGFQALRACKAASECLLACLHRHVLKVQPPDPVRFSILFLHHISLALLSVPLRVSPLFPPVPAFCLSFGSICILQQSRKKQDYSQHTQGVHFLQEEEL